MTAKLTARLRNRTNSREGWGVLSAAMLAMVTWTLWAGKDVNWDVLNHHLYLPFALVSGRYASDLFAAGPQSYQNPVGYLYLYGLIRAGAPSWLVGVCLALLHSLVFWPLHRMAVGVFGTAPDARVWRLLALALAGLTPAYLIVVGTSSIDPICSLLIVSGLASALLCGAGNPRLWAGALALGIAVGLKPSAAIFVFAIGAVLALRCLTGALAWRGGLIFGTAALLGVAVTAGPWAVWLWKAFGNPVFPLFNQVFHSPYAPTQPMIAARFMPVDRMDYLLRPWQMALFRNYTATEAFVPDLRLACAEILLGVLAVTQLLSGRSGSFLRRKIWHRADAQLGVFVLVAYPLWMATSGNARYALALLMPVGLVLVRAGQLLLPARIAAPALVALACVQTFYYLGGGDKRYDVARRWDSEPYVDVVVPERLRLQPFLHLSIGVQTNSVTALYLHPAGAMINAVGQMSLPKGGPLGNAFERRLLEWQGRTRFLFPSLGLSDDAAIPARLREKMRLLTYRTGYEVDWTDCERLRVKRGLTVDADTAATGPGARSNSDPALLSCRAVPRDVADPELERRLLRADQVFALVEAACPRIFGPTPMTSDIGVGGFGRFYMNTNAQLTVSEMGGVQLNHFRAPTAVSLGSMEDVLASRGKDACRAWQALAMQ